MTGRDLPLYLVDKQGGLHSVALVLVDKQGGFLLQDVTPSVQDNDRERPALVSCR